MHFSTLALFLVTAHLSTALVLQPRSATDGAPDGCHVSDFVSQCPSSQNADSVSTKCNGWCWPAIEGGLKAVTTFDPVYCGSCLDSFVVRGGPNALEYAKSCADFMTTCGVESSYKDVSPL